MVKFAGDNQSATILTAVTTKPAVKITDQNNAAVAGVTVTFAVASGGGALTGASTTTGSDGVATVGSWILGAAVGANTLTASASGVTGSPVTFSATGTAVVTPVATAMTKVAGDGQTAVAGTAVAVAPGVKLTDASGNPVAGQSVTFTVASGAGFLNAGGNTANVTTNASGIAAVTSWTLGTTAGANTLTAFTAGTVTGSPATFTATGTAAAFSPTGNVSISGTLTYGSINIPAGVTVTLTGDATITVSGAVTIAGSIVGDCKNLTITATGALTSTGSINNSCSGAVPTPPPSLTLVATGGYTLTSGTITTSGSLNVTNDASLNDGTFAAPPAPGLRTSGSSLRIDQCIVGAANFIANPFTGTDGVNGQFGTAGADGSTWTLQCTGSLHFIGGALVHGQYGGKGGTGTHVTSATALATGGDGGLGGKVVVRALGSLSFTGASTNVQSGSGGAGGAATATSTGVGNPGPSATSTGGKGSPPGNILIQAKNGGIGIDPGSLTLTMGDGGAGGAATSSAGNGQTTPLCPAGAGGPGTATGGSGGTVPDRQLTATGSVTGVGGVIVAGGAAGVGGAAKATGGTGGTGSQPCKPGGAGGATSATGGQGGNSLFKDATGALVANGGRGGSMEDAIGKGGQGWSDCGLVAEAGGVGGAGGNAGGKNGAGGTGLQNGAPGTATFTTVANGGNGGDGAGPGAGGAAGAPTATITVVATTIQPSFTAGAPGNPCRPQVKLKFGAIINNGGAVAPGTQIIPLQDGTSGADVGTIPYITSGNTFVSQSSNPQPRVGIAANSGHIGLKVGSAIVNAAQYVVTKVNVCTVNTSPPASPSNPVTVQHKNASGQVTSTQTIGSEGCLDILSLSDDDIIEFFGPLGADFFFAIFGHAPG